MIFETKSFCHNFHNFLNEILIKNVKTITDVTRKRYETTNIRSTTMSASLWEFGSNLRKTVLDIIKYLLRYSPLKFVQKFFNKPLQFKDGSNSMNHLYDSLNFLVNSIVIIRCRILENESRTQFYKHFQTVQLHVFTVIFSWPTKAF